MSVRSVGGVLADDPQEAQAVRRIKQLHDDGLSLRAIADVLVAEGHRTKRDGTWHPSTIARVLKRP